MSKLELRKATNEDIEKIKIVYNEAFPRSERKPFSMIEKNVANGKMEILSIYDDDFCGLVISANYFDIVLIDYFAVAEEFRSKGIGSKAIPLIRERYKDKKAFLEIELADEKMTINDQPVRRKKFYLKNGMQCADIRVKLFGVPMEILSFGKKITAEDCKKLYRNLYGKMYKMFIRFE